MSLTDEKAGVKAPPEEAFGLADFLRVLHRHKALILLTTILTIAVTFAAVTALPRLYAATAKVLLEPRKNAVADAATVLSALPTDPASVQNQLQVLASRDLALKVIAKLHLQNDPEFAVSGKGAGLDGVVNTFLSRLDVAQNGASTTIDVTFKSQDAAKAARIANALAQSYTDDQVAVKVNAARKATQWLSERMQQLSQQVQQQETAIQLYKAENDLVESAPGSSLNAQQLMAFNTQLVAAQGDLAEKKAAYDRVAALAKTGNSGDVTQVVTSKMIGDLRAQEGELIRQEADLAARYGPNHPRMIAIQNARRDLAAKIAREVEGIAGAMRSEMEVARAHVGAIEASLARTTRAARQENKARIRLNALEANLASTRTMYENFVQRLRAVQDQDDIQIPEARVISTAPVPAYPSSPKRMLFLGASVPAGVLLGILLALLLERVAPAKAEAAVSPKPQPHRPEPVRRGPIPPASPRATAPRHAVPEPAFAASVPLPPEPAGFSPPLAPVTGMAAFIRAGAAPKPPAMAPSPPQAAVPPAPMAPVVAPQPPEPALPPVLAELAGSPDLRLADWLLDNPGAPYGKALESLFAALLPGPSPQGRVVVFTAPAADAGKPVAVLALARLAALKGLRTVLIDADLGRLAPAGSQAGIAGFLQGLPLSSVMLKDRRTALYLMAAPVPVWPDKRTAGLLNHLKQNADLILIDAPSPRVAGPWPALAEASDSIVLYAAAGAPKAGLDGALRSLVAMGVSAKGVVLTR